MTIIVGHGSAIDPRSLELHTRRRWRIPNELRELEQSPVIRSEAVDIITTAHSTAELLSSSALYNCAGLAFGSRRVVIDIDHAVRILRDDGYRVEADPTRWAAGDLVLYRDEAGEPQHVAVVHSVTPDLSAGEHEVRVVSAWGENGGYLHDWADVSPLLGKPVEVWTKRI